MSTKLTTDIRASIIVEKAKLLSDPDPYWDELHKDIVYHLYVAIKNREEEYSEAFSFVKNFLSANAGHPNIGEIGYKVCLAAYDLVRSRTFERQLMQNMSEKIKETHTHVEKETKNQP